MTDTVSGERVAARIESFIRERFRVPADDGAFSRSVNLWEQGYVDSIGFVELIGFIETSFDVVLPDEAFFDTAFSTVDGMAGVVRRLMPDAADANVTERDRVAEHDRVDRVA